MPNLLLLLLLLNHEVLPYLQYLSFQKCSTPGTAFDLQHILTAIATAAAADSKQGAPVPAISQLQKVQHPTPMTSLASMRNKDELVRWGSKLALVDPEAVSWVVEPKVDGLALRAVYRWVELLHLPGLLPTYTLVCGVWFASAASQLPYSY